MGIQMTEQTWIDITEKLQSQSEEIKELKIKAQRNIHNSAFNGFVEEITQLKQVIKDLAEAVEFYEHGDYAEDYEEIKILARISFTGLNHKNSGYMEKEAISKKIGKRARSVLQKHKDLIESMKEEK